MIERGSWRMALRLSTLRVFCLLSLRRVANGGTILLLGQGGRSRFYIFKIRMSDIFISYSREDRARVKHLAEALQNSCGWSVWWDAHIPAGKTFDEVIEAALDEARCVVVVWSEVSVKSRWVKTEAGEGLDREILVPLSIDGARIPLAFRRIQTENFVTWLGDTDAGVFQKLQGDIARILGEAVEKKSVELAKKPSFLEPEMIRIPGGKFLMGSPESEQGRLKDEQQHDVVIDDFAIGKYPVTFAEYDRYCEETGRSNPGEEDWGRGQRPVINVSWEDAYDYAQWLAELTGKSYRLPNEAEWEFTARGGTKTAYWWGKQFEEDRINCNHNHGKTTPVDFFKPNPVGLYDMLGNVWEWTASLYEQDYNGSENKSADKGGSSRRVIRGGSWHDKPRYVRSALRYWSYPDDRSFTIGFRLAQD